MDDVVGFYDVKHAELRLNLLIEGDVAIIGLMGDINTYNSEFFMKRVGVVMHAGYSKYIFDLSAVKYVSSTGIGAFTNILKDLNKFHPIGTMVLCGISPRVHEVFQLLGFSNFFRIYDNLDTARLHFSAKEAPIFPKILSCPTCSHKLKATKSGRFRCNTCKSIIIIDSDGKLFRENA